MVNGIKGFRGRIDERLEAAIKAEKRLTADMPAAAGGKERAREWKKRKLRSFTNYLNARSGRKTARRRQP